MTSRSPRHDLGLDDSPTRGRLASAQRPRSVRRASARKILLRTAWLELPLVYWAGTPPAAMPARADCYSVIDLIAARLASLPAGLYAMPGRYAWRQVGEGDGAEHELAAGGAGPPGQPAHLPAGERERTAGDLRQPSAPRLEPEFEVAMPVTEAAFVDAVRAWTQAADYPRALPELIGDLDNWRVQVKQHIERVGGARRACAQLGTADPATLTIETTCWWVGPEADRPTRLVPTDRIWNWLAGDAALGTEDPVLRLAAIVLGQRRADHALWDPLESTCRHASLSIL